MTNRRCWLLCIRRRGCKISSCILDRQASNLTEMTPGSPPVSLRSLLRGEIDQRAGRDRCLSSLYERKELSVRVFFEERLYINWITFRQNELWKRSSTMTFHHKRRRFIVSIWRIVIRSIYPPCLLSSSSLFSSSRLQPLQLSVVSGWIVLNIHCHLVLAISQFRRFLPVPRGIHRQQHHATHLYP